MDAVFIVDKPVGPTSHDVVARLRRAMGMRRIGHAGTLDPLAGGVLVVATGMATRVIEYLTADDKAYVARVTLGVETDTYDAEGRVVAERPAAGVDREQVEAALAPFRGEIAQRPPAYSAIKRGGQPLYAAARRGEVVDVPLRQVNIKRLDLTDWQPPVATLYVECSKGTYIRSLAHDLGRALGCGAHLSALTRVRSGRFTIEMATPLDVLETRLRAGDSAGLGTPPDEALRDLPEVTFTVDAARRLASGVSVPAEPGGGVAGAAPGTLALAYAAGGQFLAIVRLEESDQQPVWRPEKVFVSNAGDVASTG